MNLLALLIAVATVGAVDVGEHGLVGERVVVVGSVATDDDVDVVAAALRARGLVVLDGDERHGLDGNVDVDGDREQLRAHLMASRSAWRQLDFPLAANEARLALDEALRLPRPDDHLDLIADALVFAAALRLNDNVDDVEGRRLLRLAARLEPAREALDPALHPPSRLQAWARARADNAAADSSFVVVKPRMVGSAVDVEVVVDGVRQQPQGGLLPLARGPHLITVRGPQASSSSHIVDVEGDGVVIDDVVQTTANVTARAAGLARVRGGEVAALAALLVAADADVIIALDVEGAHFGLRGGGAVVRIAADPTDPAAFASAAIAALDTPVAAATPATPPKPTTPATPPQLDDDGPPAWLVAVAVTVASGVVVGTGTVVWQLWPTAAPPPPPRPVTVSCCVQ